MLICIPLLFSNCDPIPVNPPLLDYEIYNTISIKNPEDAIQDGFYRNYKFNMYGISGEYTVPTTGDTLFTTNRHIRRTNLTDGFSYSISLIYRLCYIAFYYYPANKNRYSTLHQSIITIQS